MEKIAGEDVECLQPLLIGVDVAETPVTLNLFRRCNTDFLLSRAQQVEQKLAGGLAEAKDGTERLDSRLTALEKVAVQSFIMSAESTIPSNANKTWSATCPDGTYVVSGYCQITEGGGALQNMGASGERTWECTYGASVPKARAIARCAKSGD